MKKTSIFLICGCINVIFAILLIHKQNQIIKLLFDIQQLQEEKEQLFQQKKDLTWQLTKQQQLSHIQTYAKNDLHMKPISLRESKSIAYKKE